ncbi:MAG TPA: DUF4489 domain-containing protein [Oscillospiraceae bacterium]|nr:DUF4489 domain-containing protein [Oscillospiraceae bacterium]
MMSVSKANHTRYPSKICHGSSCHKPHKTSDIILECGCSPEAAFFEIDDGRVEEGQKFVLDRVRIDITHLIKPVIKLDFSSLIIFEAEDEEGSEHEVEVDLLFKLIRISNGEKEVIRSWSYLYEIDVENNIDELEVEMKQPFAVTFCDKPCATVCEYIMKVEGIDFEGDFDELRVVSPTLSAIAQGQC